VQMTRGCNRLAHVWVVIVVLCSSLNTSRATPYFDCGPSSNRIGFTSLTLFPNPVYIHNTVHARVTISPDVEVTSGIVSLVITFQNEESPSVTIPSIDLCSLGSVTCPINTGITALSLDFYVPEIAAGDYNIIYSVFGNSKLLKGCISFNVTVFDDSQGNTYTSWFQAQLLGTAQFEQTDYTKRSKGDIVQVGKINGNEGFSDATSATFPWGTIASLEGSEDLVPPFFSTQGYIWGLWGGMSTLTINPDGSRIQIFGGSLIVGYVDSYVAYNTSDNYLVSGSFVFNWTFVPTANGVNTILTGTIDFDSNAFLPTGWPSPITFGRLNPLYVSNDASGNLIVNGSTTYCRTQCEQAEITGSGESGLSVTDYLLIFLLIFGSIGFAILGYFGIQGLRRFSRKKEEDSMFSLGNKPRYGSALVVDDIKQETKGYDARLEEGEGDFSSDYSSPEEKNPEKRAKRNPLQHLSKSFSETSPGVSPRKSDERDTRRHPRRGRRASTSRSRSRSRSISVSASDDYESPRHRRDSRDSSASRVTEEEESAVESEGSE